jgi:hypothetical protein
VLIIPSRLQSSVTEYVCIHNTLKSCQNSRTQIVKFERNLQINGPLFCISQRGNETYEKWVNTVFYNVRLNTADGAASLIAMQHDDVCSTASRQAIKAFCVVLLMYNLPASVQCAQAICTVNRTLCSSATSSVRLLY